MEPAAPDATSAEARSPAARAIAFAVVCLTLLTASLVLPVRDWWSIESLTAWSQRLGWRAPLWILLIGLVAPPLFLPRWPIAMVCGILYGIASGALLANVASTLGAAAHYAMARSMLAPWCRRILERRRSRWLRIEPARAFLALFLLRAFPLSNFVATNLLAGTLRVPFSTYVTASFLGMIPSSLMYAAWGKLMREPSPLWYAVAAASLAFIALGTWWVQRRRPQMARRGKQ